MSTCWPSGCATRTSPTWSCTTRPYGRVLDCVDPLGDHLQIDEHSDDLYGYRLHQPVGVAPGLRVMPLRLADPLGGYGDFLGLLGCVPRGAATEHFAAFTLGEGGHGLVGVHPPDGPGERRRERAAAGQSRARLPLLRDHGGAGHGRAAAGASRVPGVRGTSAHIGDVLSVSDADGLRLEVHVTPSAP